MPRVYPEDVTACCYVEVKHRCTGLPHDQANARPSRRRAPQRIGYAQVGPEQADLREAVTELCALGVESHHVYVDRGPWLRAKDRPEFRCVLDALEPGDILVAASPARLARSHSDLANIVEKLTGADVEVEIAGSTTSSRFVGGIATRAGRLRLGRLNSLVNHCPSRGLLETDSLDRP